MTGTLERVLVRPPLAEDVEHWREYGWRAAPDHAAAALEHEVFCGILEDAGAEVVVSRHDPGNPDAIYVYDPVLVGSRRRGAPQARQGRASRRAGSARGVRSSTPAFPIAAEIAAPGRRGGRRHGLARREHAAGRRRLPHELSGARRARGTHSPASTSWRSTSRTGTAATRSCTSCRSSLRSTAISRSSTRGSRRCACSSSSPSAGSPSSRCRTTSSRRRDRNVLALGAAPRARARRKSRDPTAHGAGRRRRRRLPGRGDLAEGRRRARPASRAAAPTLDAQRAGTSQADLERQRLRTSPSVSWRYGERPGDADADEPQRARAGRARPRSRSAAGDLADHARPRRPPRRASSSACGSRSRRTGASP